METAQKVGARKVPLERDLVENQGDASRCGTPLRGDDRSPSAVPRDEPPPLELGERLVRGHSANAVQLREGGVGGQPIARSQPSARDLISVMLRDLTPS